jgi:hypothetical protein
MPKEIAIRVSPDIASHKIVAAVDRSAAELGLTVTMRGTLKTFAGSTHWHLKRDRGRGTVEITWWPQRRRLWIKIQAARAAPWIDEIAPRLKRKVESHLASFEK